MLVPYRTWGLDIRFPHNSFIWGDAAKVDHATSKIRQSSDSSPYIARLAIVGYKHEGLFFANQGHYEEFPGGHTLM